MAKWQNTSLIKYDGVGNYDVPEILPVYSLPEVNRFIEFDYCNRVRSDKDTLGVHFFEDDYKFERVWTSPERYAQMLKEFGFIIGPDFSQYVDYPKAMQIYNHYRNNWLCRFWQDIYDITIVPTVMWGFEDSYDWCFDGYPTESIVAVSNVGLCKDKTIAKMFINGYNEMMKRLNPSQVLFFSRNFLEVPGNVKYIRWEIHKGDQVDG